MNERASLASQGNLWVPLGLLVSLGTLITGLMLPMMRVEKLVLWKEDFSILTGVKALWTDHQHFLAAVILIFSVIFPILKLLGLLIVWFTPMNARARAAAVRAIDLLGRWSMLDVFVVAVTVVIASSKASLDASPRPGLYVFAGAVALSMFMTTAVERVAARPAPAS